MAGKESCGQIMDEMIRKKPINSQPLRSRKQFAAVPVPGESVMHKQLETMQ